MEQLSIFNHTSLEVTPWKLYIDGASRNNPGPSGAGIVLVKDNHMVQQGGYYLGIRTNNQAEYLALLLGIFTAKQHMHHDDHLVIISDSELLVLQMQGLYKVKDAELKKFSQLAHALLKGLFYRIEHVLREENKDADAMANKGIDEKGAVPADFITLLSEHAISWR